MSMERTPWSEGTQETKNGCKRDWSIERSQGSFKSTRSTGLLCFCFTSTGNCRSEDALEAVGDVEVDDVKRPSVAVFLCFESLGDGLVRGEVRELVVRGGAVEGCKGRELVGESRFRLNGGGGCESSMARWNFPCCTEGCRSRRPRRSDSNNRRTVRGWWRRGLL
ncbi:hypothetical protein HPP92_017714 [Vanilla planifolia]|uniref:Uncharacterized protein n=1 Tax=Vanilla planifolia TaxID=51239 RepID=A0A835UQU2_VANPL|nr:hypothetical protein HPP92_017714 [Vanilla planifolia]